MINASEDTVRGITAVLGRASLFDDRITAGDAARIAAWSEAVESYRFDQADLLAAVTAHYQGSSETMRVNDLIAASRKIRGERAEQEKARDLPEVAPPDPQSMGLALHTTGDPIWKAYDQHSAIDLPCETCSAGEHEACVNLATNMTRRIPCVSRLTAGFRRSKRGSAA